MEKKSRKNIIIGFSVLLLVTLTLLGLTYAYYRTRIIGNPNNESISVTSKKMEVTYNDGDANVEIGAKVEPSNETEYTKIFTVNNTGDETVYYSIILEDMENTFQRNQDWEYTLTVGSETIASGYLAVGTHQVLVGSRELTEDTNTETYTLTLKYVNSEEDQSSDMGQTLKFKVNISEESYTWKDAPEGSLLYALRTNQPSGSETTVPGRAASTANEARILTTEDDYGTSYVYRGNVENNYVTYAGMCWRIVRVQGDGTIKIVLADRDNVCGADSETGYSSSDNQSAFIADPSAQGFAYKYNLAYDESDFIYEDSDINAVLNAWVNGGSYKYIDIADTWEERDGTFTQKISDKDQEKLASAEWCNDTSVTSKRFYDYSGYEIYATDENFDELLSYTELYYGAYDRLNERYKANPSLKCNSVGVDGSTPKKYVSNVGILSADEVAFAGGVSYGGNNSYYLKTNAQYEYWTMSPSYFIDEYDDLCVWFVHSSGDLYLDYHVSTYDVSVRPAVVLRSDVTIEDGGIGTQNNPYVVK